MIRRPTRPRASQPRCASAFGSVPSFPSSCPRKAGTQSLPWLEQGGDRRRAQKDWSPLTADGEQKNGAHWSQEIMEARRHRRDCPRDYTLDLPGIKAPFLLIDGASIGWYRSSLDRDPEPHRRLALLLLN